MPEAEVKAPERIWLQPIEVSRHKSQTYPSMLPYVPESRLDEARQELGHVVMLLLQEQFTEARERALQIPIEFPDGRPLAT